MEAIHVVHGAEGSVFQPGTRFKADEDRAEFLKRHGAAKIIKLIEQEPEGDKQDGEDKQDDETGTDGEGTVEDEEDGEPDPEDEEQGEAATATGRRGGRRGAAQ
jgi:hypothetical protein